MVDDRELRFDGRVAVVTGGGRGLGRAYGLLLAERGARVVVNDAGVSVVGRPTDEDPAAEVVAEIGARGGEAVASTDSVATSAGGRAIIETALDTWGRIDIVVNNAGVGGSATAFEDITDDQLRSVIDTHLLGAFNTLRPAWPHLVAAGYGRVLNVSSSSALGMESSWDYPAAKAGLIGLTKSLAIRGRAAGIRVNALMPMAYTRPMADYSKEAIRRWMAANFRPEQVAPVAAWLVHDQVPCSGEVFHAGAGQVARVVFAVTPGFRDPDLTLELVSGHFDEVMDLDGLHVVRDSRESSALFQGEAAWRGDDSDYGR